MPTEPRTSESRVRAFHRTKRLRTVKSGRPSSTGLTSDCYWHGSTVRYASYGLVLGVVPGGVPLGVVVARYVGVFAARSPRRPLHHRA